MTRRHLLLLGTFALLGRRHGRTAQAEPAREVMRVDAEDRSYEEEMRRLAIPFRRDLPQTFACGDSISVGYTPALKVALRNEVNITHRRDLPCWFPALVQPLAGYTGRLASLIEYTRAVLGSGDYSPDWLLVNSGLHDVARGTAGRKEEEYTQGLAALLTMVKPRRARLVWVQTTPKGAGHRDNAGIAACNGIAARLLGSKGIPLIDLHAFTTTLVSGHGEARVFRLDQVHFTRFASEAQGRFLAAQLTAIHRQYKS
jgi:hypothetical protein